MGIRVICNYTAEKCGSESCRSDNGRLCNYDNDWLWRRKFIVGYVDSRYVIYSKGKLEGDISRILIEGLDVWINHEKGIGC